jgi:DNA primase
MAIPPDFLEDLRNRVAVSDVVRRHVQLRKQGREWAGLSPFNKEKSPSFFVNDDKRFYHCFSSGKHGDVFSFLTETSGLSFREAVESVAEMAGMEVPSDGPEAAEHRRVTKGVQESLEVATLYFESQLRMPIGQEALAYLHGRGLDDATIRRFRLGFAPPAFGSLTAGVARDGVNQGQLVEAGLLKRRDDDKVVDYFRDRVMFPITDRQGKVIAFGGRTLGDGQPKYLNSPETAAFHKGRVLYGLAQAREAAHKSGQVLVVEGYMDVIALAQAGIAHAVAPLGTAVGEDQIRLLWTLSAEPIMCLDGDRAGRAAAIRSAERAMPLLQPGRSLRFAMLPTGEDPDTLVRKAGPDAIRTLSDSAESLENVLWQAEWDRHTPTTPERRAAFHRAILDQVKRVADETVRIYYEQSMRERLRQAFVTAPSTPQYPRKPRGSWSNKRRSWGDDASTSTPQVRRRADPRRLMQQRQRTLIGLLALHPALISDLAEQVSALNFADAMLDRLRSRILSLGSAVITLDAATLASQVTLTTTNQPSDDGSMAERLFKSACESAQAVFSGDLAEEQDSLMIARRAAEELIHGLEHDTVRADIANQVENLGQAPDTLDRLEASVAAERSRAPTQY